MYSIASPNKMSKSMVGRVNSTKRGQTCSFVENQCRIIQNSFKRNELKWYTRAQTLEKYNFEGFGMDEAFLTKEIWPKMKKFGYYSTGWKREVLLISLITLFSILSIFGIIFLVKKLYTKYKNGRMK